MTIATASDLGAALVAKLNTLSLPALGLLGGVHDTIVPPGTQRPYVRFQTLDSEDVNTIGALVYSMHTVLVQVVCEDRALASVIYAAIHAGIDRARLTFANGTHDTTYRSRAQTTASTPEDGRTYWHVGGIYMIGVQQP